MTSITNLAEDTFAEEFRSIYDYRLAATQRAISAASSPSDLIKFSTSNYGGRLGKTCIHLLKLIK